MMIYSYIYPALDKHPMVYLISDQFAFRLSGSTTAALILQQTKILLRTNEYVVIIYVYRLLKVSKTPSVIDPQWRKCVPSTLLTTYTTSCSTISIKEDYYQLKRPHVKASSHQC